MCVGIHVTVHSFARKPIGMCQFYILNVHGSVHLKNILLYIQQDATLHSSFYLETALHVSGGTSTHHQERKTNVSTASGICQTVTAICR
jgi:hypothetical protein